MLPPIQRIVPHLIMGEMNISRPIFTCRNEPVSHLRTTEFSCDAGDWSVKIVNSEPTVHEAGRLLDAAETKDRAQEWACAVFMAMANWDGRS